ncbi:hypothetical protein BBJ29_004994 [Phytophthora kernoviae]|uniref:PH domain-containing protein n=1 Tax=Phytophthora kernoviae TaxID=325452 RepID=A0A3F2RZ34_9STRA|nr:hypothetical protein BBP00_00001830 [Phytophthora kernoviae]RLN71839.1 hypothetical protein BBJ29_004994 [Phytophthora kernoviae]
MRSRWVDSIKRGITPSPRGERSPQPSGNTSAATPSSTLSSVSATSLNGAENPAYNHDSDSCDCVGACSVARVLENCVLQGGVHHTHMHVLTYLGRPLRSECCCYPVAVQWFRAVGEQDDFQVIPGACEEWYTPTADDIGARILAKVMIEDEDVLKTKMLEYGPIKADPEVRSKVEMYLERKSVLFMGLQSISVKDGSEYLNDEELRESWTLLIDDRRVRLTCESSLIPPFESLYTPDIKLEMVQGKPNEFFLHLAQGCYVRLRAESNTVRDIIVLTLRAFCKEAVSYETTQDAVACGQSPMLTLRKIAQEEETKRLPPVGASAKFGGLVGLSCMLRLYTPSLTFDQQAQETVTPPPGPVRLSLSSSVGGGIAGSEGWQQDDDLDDSLLLDAEALIGNAHKMGIQYQILPRAPKRISIADIPDLLIIEAIENLNVENAAGKRSRQGRAIEDFMAGKSDDLKTESVDVSALRERYVAIFCALQRELHTYKQRVVTLSKQLEENQEQNTSFRKDIESLRSALTSMQVTDKVYDLVTTDLQKLVQRTESVDTPSIPGLVSPST